MLLTINKAVVYFIFVCFFAMVIPYWFNLGGDNLFLKDFYAKRIMTLFSLFLFVYIIILILAKKKLNLNINILIYIIIYIIVFLYSFINQNSIGLIITDAFISILPIFFFFLVFNTSFSTHTYKQNFLLFLFIACTLVLFNIKLQFSYFSLLGIVYIIFLTKFNVKTMFFIAFLPLIVINSLIGKSSLLMLIFIVGYFFVFDRKMVSKQKKIYIALIPTVLIILGTIIFWDKIQSTGAYRNTIYFFSHTDFSNLNFKDKSTGHRLFEAERVLEEFDKSNIFTKVFGRGFGATIDLSATTDFAVINANKDTTKVRHIHIGFFAVLYRFGLIGISIYFLFIRKIIFHCKIILRNSNDPSLVLGALYLLIIIFDSFISFPHMMSNFMFWFITFIIIRESELIKRKITINNDLSEFRTL